MTAKIIIIDDEDMFLRLIKRSFKKQLREEKYKFSYCSDGLEALKRIKRDRPDLVLIDLEMSNVNGFEVIKQIQDSNPEIPIVIVSTYGSKDNYRQAMNCQVYDFLTKPINFQAMESTIDKALEFGQTNKSKLSKVVTIQGSKQNEQKISEKPHANTIIKLLNQLNCDQLYNIFYKIIENKFKPEDIQDFLSDLQVLVIESREQQEEEEILKGLDLERKKQGLIPLSWIKKGKIDKRYTRKKLASGKIKKYGPFFYLRYKVQEQEEFQTTFLGRYEEIEDPELLKAVKKQYPELVEELESQIKQYIREPNSDNNLDESWDINQKNKRPKTKPSKLLPINISKKLIN